MAGTMVLRFRDLVADTILEHKKVILKDKYVWWGWWNKPDEKIPRRTFNTFNKTIKKNKYLWIFLVDSGKEQLYKARLNRIDMSKNEKIKFCNETDKTPGYYASQKYKVWFSFLEILKVPNNEIKKWSYDEVGDFIDDPNGDIFKNKKVFSIQEMLNRKHRTIYFIKQFQKSHKDYYVNLIPNIGPKRVIEITKEMKDIGKFAAIPPNKLNNFMPNPIYKESDYIIHLSDLHFINDDKYYKYPIKSDRSHSSLATCLYNDMIQLDNNASPACVIISGDLTWRGKSKEFDLVQKFIHDLRSHYNLNLEDFIIIPGNHDIEWSNQGKEYDPNKKVVNPPNKAENNYKEFVNKVFGIAPNKFLSMGRRYLLKNFITIDVVGLNSCRLEQKHFSGYGFVGLEQLEDAFKQMEWRKSSAKTKYRILTFHHHLLPVAHIEEIENYNKRYSISLDSGQIINQALKNEVDLALHGHQHQPFLSTISKDVKSSSFPKSRTLSIHGAGSVGVQNKYLGSVSKNSYSILKFSEDSIKFDIRTSSENRQGFDCDRSCICTINLNGGIKISK